MNLIGSGSFGQVYSAQRISDNCLVAIKKFKRGDSIGCDVIQSTSLREIINLNKCKHNNIIEILEIIYDSQKNDLALVFPLADYNLHEYIRKCEHENKLQCDLIKNIFQQLTLGIDCIHSQGVIHRDIKPINILIMEQSQLTIKIGDFGLSRIYYNAGQLEISDDKITEDVVTLNYKPPEILLGSNTYDYSIDIWSLGCLLYFICTGDTLFNAESEIGMLFKIFSFTGTPSPQICPTLTLQKHYKQTIFPKFIRKSMTQDQKIIRTIGIEGAGLLDQMLQLEPALRPTCKQILSHPFFS